MDLRPARLADAPTIGAYHLRCWREGFRDILDAEVLDGLDGQHQVERWRTRLEDGTATTIVATIDDRPIGHVLVVGDTIGSVFVDPDHWGAGIGRTLLGIGEAMVAEEGHGQAVLWTMVGNHRAIGLYESAGWTQDGTTATHTASFGVPVDELRMVKDLPTRRA